MNPLKDEQGKFVLWQTPNLPVIVGVISGLLAKVLPAGRLDSTAMVVSFGALFTWAWLELFDGASYFRRLLGLAVLVLLIANRI